MACKIVIDVAGSSCIGHAEYDPASRVLRIGFIGGSTYDYHPVSPEIVDAFIAAASKGQFVNAVIKPHYGCRKLA